MKKPDDNNDVDFSEYMWMAEDGAEDSLQQQVEEEMVLIEQDFLEAMFDDLLAEEDEQQVYFDNSANQPSQSCQENTNCAMQLPKIQSNLNPNAPAFVPRFAASASS